MTFRLSLLAIFSAFAWTACGDDSGGPDGLEMQILDLTGFTRFELDQVPGSAPEGCPDPILVNPAAIERLVDGTYRFTFSLAFESQDDLESCLESAADPDECTFATPEPGPERLITQAELTALLADLARVPVRVGSEPCEEGSVDQCGLLALTWDDLDTTDQECGAAGPTISTNTALNLIRLVTSFARTSLAIAEDE
ncbi:MAG: hypothetical protein AAF997_07520 [Myxococcota bacterium]